jgi:hypothetical protein
MKTNQAKDWQKNPNTLTCDRIQLWLASGTMLGLRDLSEARELVEKGWWFVISHSAIGQYDTN